MVPSALDCTTCRRRCTTISRPSLSNYPCATQVDSRFLTRSMVWCEEEDKMARSTPLCFLALGLAVVVSAEVPDERGILELQARTNIVDGYNLPPNSSYNSKTPSLADTGQVAVSLSIVGGDVDTVGLWLGASGTGSVVWTDAAGPLISDCSLNNAGLVVFQLTFASPDGLYFFDDSDDSWGS